MRVMLFWAALGYLSGSVLFARVTNAIFRRGNAYLRGEDRNPGAANAFRYGGFWCGALTLLGDLGKGFVPVWLCLHAAGPLAPWALPVVLAAPVVGHILPVFYHFRGGKGIAVTFGCLLGLAPALRPVLIFAAAFVFFSTACRVSPHFYRTLAAYLLALFGMIFAGVAPAICVAFALITAAVCLRLRASPEVRRKMEVRLLWMR